MRLRPVYNKKLGRWALCHDQWCEPGETSAIATVLTSEHPAQDEAWAKNLCDAFNALEEQCEAELATRQKAEWDHANGGGVNT